MKDLLKRMEIALRQFILRALGKLTRRRKHLPPDVDFNNCKFLFIRQDRIGDVLVSTPLFALIKKHYPEALIDVLLSTNNYFVLDHEPMIRKRWVYTKRFITSFRTLFGIRAEKYDFVIDLMDNPSATSTVIALLAGGRWNVGLEKDNRYAYDIVVPLLSRKETHIVDRLAQLVTVFGIRPENEKLQVRFIVEESAQKAVDTFLDTAGVRSGKKVGINISAGSDTRFWGVSRYQALLRLIESEKNGAKVILLYKPSDRGRAEEIAQSVSSVVLAPELTFNGFAALIRRLDVLITPDTSAVHLASAFQIPSVVLYVQSNTNLRIWEPYRTLCESLVTKVDDLSTIPVPGVFDALQRLLKRMEAAKRGSGAGMTERV